MTNKELRQAVLSATEEFSAKVALLICQWCGNDDGIGEGALDILAMYIEREVWNSSMQSLLPHWEESTPPAVINKDKILGIK